MRRTTAWTTAVAGPALVGISLLTAPAALAQTVDCAVYPDRCEVNDVVIDRDTDNPTDGTSTNVKRTVNNRTPPGTPERLPFTGGEVVALTLLGAGAVAGGAALVVAGRRRTSSSG